MKIHVARFGALLAAMLLMTSLVPQAAAVTTPDNVDLDLTLDPAPVAALAGQMDITVLPAATTGQSLAVDPEPGIRCNLKIAIHFRGVRNLDTGVVSGNWGYASTIDCNGPMEYLYTQADLLKSGSVNSSALSDDCDAIRDGVCQLVASNGASACSFCNGSWRGNGDFTVEFPAGSVALDYDHQRCSAPNPSTLVCNLKTGRVFL